MFSCFPPSQHTPGMNYSYIFRSRLYKTHCIPTGSERDPFTGAPVTQEEAPPDSHEMKRFENELEARRWRAVPQLLMDYLS